MESTFNKDHLQAASHEAPIVKKRKRKELTCYMTLPFSVRNIEVEV